jgi:hypothetical protein
MSLLSVADAASFEFDHIIPHSQSDSNAQRNLKLPWRLAPAAAADGRASSAESGAGVAMRPPG